MSKIAEVQKALSEEGLDGWLFYDFRRSNDLACRFLEIPPDRLLTRRFFYWIPVHGEPVKIVHAIEENALHHLRGETVRYRTWQELEGHLKTILKGHKKIAMEYSPRNAIPTVAKVDAGTIELVRAQGVEVVSSADLMQKYTCVWDERKLHSHLAAAAVLDQTVARAWNFIQSNPGLSEHDVQQFILLEFVAHGFMTEDPPICAVNAHSADPHYSPLPQGSSIIKKGDFVLIDLWCKQKEADSVYADITRVGVAAAKPTKKQQEIFDIVKEARDTATEFVKQRFAQGNPPMGYEVDDVARHVIAKSGYGENFIHRTGHNIDTRDHGPGANIDNFETQDRRRLLAGTCFSIEPGIYLPGEFGVRLEYDLFVHFDSRIEVTGGIQNKIMTF